MLLEWIYGLGERMKEGREFKIVGAATRYEIVKSSSV